MRCRHTLLTYGMWQDASADPNLSFCGLVLGVHPNYDQQMEENFFHPSLYRQSGPDDVGGRRKLLLFWRCTTARYCRTFPLLWLANGIIASLSQNEESNTGLREGGAQALTDSSGSRKTPNCSGRVWKPTPNLENRRTRSRLRCTLLARPTTRSRL
jgi:hypothetical protein